MGNMGRTGYAIGLALLAAAALAGAAQATPSGLNNIPTADVVGQDELVVQGFSEFGKARGPSWFAGFKYGPARNWEVGLDDTVAGAGSAGGPTLQAKYRLEVGPRTAVALGAANISDDRGRHGDVFPYAVVSHDLGEVRGHLGRSWQTDNGAWFVGLDGEVSPGLTLRADWTQVQEGEESVTSLGFIRPLSAKWLVEAWASFPSVEGGETSYIVKFNFVVPLRRS